MQEIQAAVSTCIRCAERIHFQLVSSSLFPSIQCSIEKVKLKLKNLSFTWPNSSSRFLLISSSESSSSSSKSKSLKRWNSELKGKPWTCNVWLTVNGGGRLYWFHWGGVKHRCPTKGRGLLDKWASFAWTSSFLGPKTIKPLLLFIFHTLHNT